MGDNEQQGPADLHDVTLTRPTGESATFGPMPKVDAAFVALAAAATGHSARIDSGVHQQEPAANTYVDYEDDSDDWRQGECDRCYGETVDGPLGPIHCACAIGQGASEDDCVCGPPDAAA